MAETEAAIVGGPTHGEHPRLLTLHRRSEGRADRTILTYLNALCKLDDFLESRGMPRELRAIRREHLEAWIVDMRDRGLQAGTILIRFRAVHTFLPLAGR